MLFRDGGEGSGIEVMIDSDDRLDAARWLYEREIMKHPGRLLMLCDRSHVLARSDRAETVPRQASAPQLASLLLPASRYRTFFQRA